jgi:hypothetical protein
MGSRANDDASDGRQNQVLIVEVAAERGESRFNLTAAQGI